MQAPFERTLRALDAERRRFPFVSLVALLALAAWIVWAVLAHVEVSVVSERARVEAREPIHVLRAEATGRLVALNATLGRAVASGDELYTIDLVEPSILATAAESRRVSIAAEREALSWAIEAAASARDAGGDVLLAAQGEAKARIAQGRAALTQAERELARAQQLGEAFTTQDLERARATVSLRRAEVNAASALTDRLAAEETRAQSDRASALDRLRQEQTRLDRESAEAEADFARAKLQESQRRVRAPIAGKLGELPVLRGGDLVEAGQALGTIVPDGALQVVAYFPAERALGRVARGAKARMKLDAYPWTWFGQLHAVVREVALEPQAGLVRVELEVDDAGELVLAHGLTGSVEVALEQTTPLALLLRAAGR